ncbi:arsenate reductase family protein [Catellicoccus marimammalium]|uniref:Arsenate reductase n=1 Tax=Catellicoccus marimammalium M35/04/3 TaxID=1234409 RepID=K8ZQD7_9ENTE|nr:arsenate reductase family protein [Catellicoccus marimammalium]EKU27791.1 Arsenate reductase [Catellicoccus marimammalium M35/04/3]
MNTFYWYPKCSTCRKAKKFLDEHNVSYEAIDMITNTPDKATILAWLERKDYPIRRYFNTSGQKYRASGLKEKLDEMSLEECAEVLSQDGMLLRRPILVTENGVAFGFKEDQYKEMLNLD